MLRNEVRLRTPLGTRAMSASAEKNEHHYFLALARRHVRNDSPATQTQTHTLHSSLNRGPVTAWDHHMLVETENLTTTQARLMVVA